MVSGGVLVFQGIEAHSPSADISDYRHFMSDKSMVETFPNYTLENGYRVEMLERGRRFRTTYRDPTTDSEFDVIHTAVSTPVM